jgi:hypothetical protein
MIGPSGGYLFRSKEDISGSGWLPVDDPFRRLELSGQAGISVMLLEQFDVSIRWSYSLLPVRLNPGNPVRYLDRGQYNNSLAFTLGYRMNIRK